MNRNDWNNGSDESDIGKQIEDLVQNAINSVDFSGLSEKIRETVDSAQSTAKQTGDAWRKAQYQREQSNVVVEERRSYVPPVQKPRELQPVFKRIPGRFSGPLSIAVGAVGVCFFASVAAGFGIPLLAGVVETGLTIATGVAAGFGVFSGVILGRGVLSRRQAKRYLTYQTVFKNRTHISLEDLQAETGYPMKTIKKDMHRIVDEKLLPVSFLDEQEKYLILSNDVYQQYLAAEAGRKERERLEEERENASPEEKKLQQIQEDEKAILTEIDRVRQVIDTPVMQEKVDRLRLLIERLYNNVKSHPEKYSEIYRVRDYYLPTVLKLLKTYDEIEDQPIQGENIKKTRDEIEKSLDMINEAMEVMFDDIFRDIAMDTSADISVLETMLSRDGWKGKDLSAQGDAPDTLKF